MSRAVAAISFFPEAAINTDGATSAKSAAATKYLDLIFIFSLVLNLTAKLLLFMQIHSRKRLNFQSPGK
ncbi:MAG: hypothetical protein EGQ86_00860 [Alistipes sp.]|nr:hypothetical protein [Alistipes sp.]